jgi:hypothetical protein
MTDDNSNGLIIVEYGSIFMEIDVTNWPIDNANLETSSKIV